MIIYKEKNSQIQINTQAQSELNRSQEEWFLGKWRSETQGYSTREG